MHFCTGYCEIFNGSTVKVFKKIFSKSFKNNNGCDIYFERQKLNKTGLILR